MKHLKTFNESEVSSGNASGKAGVGSLEPFGTGYYKSGNNGEFGTQFTPSAEPTFKTYKSMKHSKKNIKKKTKNSTLVENISNLKLESVKDTDIIKLVCDYGLCVEDRDGYGEWNKYMVYNRAEEAMFQTPKQIADAILELLKYDINTYCEIGIFKGGSHLLITEMLKLKNPNLKTIGIDIQDKHMTEDIKNYINLHIGTSEDYKGEKFDLVFIDGDHSYEGIKTDYENLGQYAKIVMFHDVNDSTCPGVVKFWNEIKEGKEFKEFTYQTNNQPIQGIGLLFNSKVITEKSKIENLKDMLNDCTEAQQLIFKRMYSHNNLELSINEVVDKMDKSKIDHATYQVENTLKKLFNKYNI
jgi:hypothetical protein